VKGFSQGNWRYREDPYKIVPEGLREEVSRSLESGK
jgi:hypothetical protein